ncbi:hypothetical protein KY285_030671 [Solanum tuberosum]|nr:hypothetical protein KY285_030671 [Solanum tuberosum]
MDNGKVVAVVAVVEGAKEEEVILTNSTMKIKITSHSEVMVVINEEVEDVEPIKSNVEEKSNLVDYNKDEDESTLLLTLKEKDTADCNLWYLDNGASNHMCGHKDKFVEINTNLKCLSLSSHIV